MDNHPISIHGLHKRYDDLTAVDHIDLEVRQGEFYGLLGPNGAGKSTTINILSGLTLKTDGEVTIFGHDLVKEYRRCRRLVGLVPQEFNFDQFARLGRMLIFQGGYFGLPMAECRQRADELMAEFSLSDKAHEQIKKLSGGMKRRAIIARALMHRPRLLILDEPTAGVDVDLRKVLWSMLRRLNSEGTTILLTTHYIEEAEALCDRIGIIHNGKVIAQDSTRNMVKRLDRELVIVNFQSSLDRGRLEALQGLSPSLSADGEELTLTFHRSEITYNDVIARVMALGVPLQGIRPGENRLEKVFLELTQGPKHGTR
ncbi:MAG: ABC transporter ATP-binding protein [Verrucomicrobia bacterium]|nr:ABC transporter ATP-binding protein [Verrucomicrobiota bacterium]